MRLVGRDDALQIRYEFRERGPGNLPLFQGEFSDSPEADPLVQGIDSPPGPLWGRVWVFLEDIAVGEGTGDRSRVAWDNFRVRQYPSGEPPPPW